LNAKLLVFSKKNNLRTKNKNYCDGITVKTVFKKVSGEFFKSKDFFCQHAGFYLFFKKKKIQLKDYKN